MWNVMLCASLHGKITSICWNWEVNHRQTECYLFMQVIHLKRSWNYTHTHINIWKLCILRNTKRSEYTNFISCRKNWMLIQFTLEGLSVQLYPGFPRLQNNYFASLKINFTLRVFDTALPALTQEFFVIMLPSELNQNFVPMRTF